MKRFLLYLGCTIPTKQYAYELSVRAVMPKLGVELEDFTDAGCCGYPLKGVNKKAWFYMAARVLAQAADRGLPILTLCNGCDVSLREIAHFLKEDPTLREEIGRMLAEEGLRLDLNVTVLHTIEVLHDVVGVKSLEKLVVKPLKGLKIASFPGCHVMRPSTIVRPEDVRNPVKIDNILRALGAETEDHPEKRNCCGATALPYSADDAAKVVALRLKGVAEWGFDAVTTSCPYCMEMLDAKQEVAKRLANLPQLSVPVFYLTQLVGLALGLKPEELGINLNASPVETVLEKLGVG